MKARDKRLALLRVLGQETAPIGLAELMGKLNHDFSGRTVRRWLNELARQGVVEKTGDNRGRKYSIKRSEAKASNSCFGSDSLSAIEYVQKPLFERNPTAYHTKWFESYRPNVSFYIPREIREELENAGQRASHQDPAGTYAHRIFHRLLIDLSFNSSRLEGNTYSLLDTERLILAGRGAEGKLDEEKVMILNHKEAIRYLVENAKRLEVSYTTICTVHYLLSDGLIESKYSGKIRDHWVRISGSTYIPFENPSELESRLQQIASVAQEIQDPFEQSLFLLIHLSYLQAFSDVNKRTARLSANIPLILGNLVPLSFNDIEKDDYMSAIIAIYELQDTRPMVDLFVYSYMRTCAAYDATIQAMGFDEIRVRYREQRRELLRQILLQTLVGKKLDRFIQSQSLQIPAKDRIAFLEDIYEDLDQMDENRLAGLGITPDQLQRWQSSKILS